MGTINDRGEFRRQMLSVIAGALISMATTTGIATFQWYTAKAEQHRMEQAESLSQFGAAVGSLASLQGGIYHQAERLALLSARANRLAVASESGDKQVVSAYEDYVKLAWDVAFEEAHLYEEVGKSTAAVSLAYYKLAFAFKGLTRSVSSRIPRKTRARISSAPPQTRASFGNTRRRTTPRRGLCSRTTIGWASGQTAGTAISPP